MIRVLEQIYTDSKSGLYDTQEQLVRDLKQTVEKRAYQIMTQDIPDKEIISLLGNKIQLLLEQYMNEAMDLVEIRNIKVFKDICKGELEIGLVDLTSPLTKMTQSKVMQSQTTSRLSRFHMYDQGQQLKRSLLAKQLVKKKQEQKMQRQRRLQKIVEEEAETNRLKQEEYKKQKDNIIWARAQKSLEKYKVVKQRYQQDHSQNHHKIQTIKQLQNKLNNICRHTQNEFKSLDIKRNKELQTSRTETLVQRRNQMKVDYRQIDEHDHKYLEKLRQVESDRLSRFNQRKSEDINAIKLIKPFIEVYIPQDSTEEIRARVIKMKQFKQYVRQNIKPKIDPLKRKQIIKSIIDQDASRYRSLGIVKQEANGVIVEKQLPKINLRSIGNEYMKHAKKMKSRLQYRPQIIEEQSSSKQVFTNYLKDLKKQQRKRLSRSQQISKSQAPTQEKVKRIQIAIGCLENQIKKHKTLIRNSAGLPSDKVQELKETIDEKNVQIAKLKFTMVNLIEED